MKLSKRMKRYFNGYNIAIAICAIAIIIALIIILKPNGKKKYTADGVEVAQSKVKADQEISRDEAIKVAVKQFKNLGEDVKAEDVQCLEIRRKEEKYYHLSSKKNTLEIKQLGGQVTRINNVIVE